VRTVVVVVVVVALISLGWLAGTSSTREDPSPELSALRSDMEALHAALCAELEVARAENELLRIDVQALDGSLPPLGGRDLLESSVEPAGPLGLPEISDEERHKLILEARVIARIRDLPRLPCES